MLETLIDPFSQGIGQRALIELIILGAVCGPLGVWIVLYRQSYAAESLAHSMLPGLVLAALIGIPLGLGAAAGLAVAALCIAACTRQRMVTADVAIAVTITALFGAGTLLALSPNAPLRLSELLFGDPLSVTASDLFASGALAVVLVAALLAGYRAFAVVGFDSGVAASLGFAPGRVAAGLLILLAATTLIAVQALGNLLVVAIVIAPAAAALRICARLPSALVTAAAIAMASGVGGLYLSFYADLAAGASVALCACAAFLLTLPLRRTTLAGGSVSGSPVDALGSAG